MRISEWSSDVCSSDLPPQGVAYDLDLGGVDEDEVVLAIPGAEEVVALRDVLGGAERQQPRPLHIGQRSRVRPLLGLFESLSLTHDSRLAIRAHGRAGYRSARLPPVLALGTLLAELDVDCRPVCGSSAGPTARVHDALLVHPPPP